MVELAEHLSVTKRNVTSLVDGLEKEALAVRHPHPADRRSTLVALTEAGEAVYSKAAKLHTHHLELLLSELDPSQQRAMAQALTQITHILASRGSS